MADPEYLENLKQKADRSVFDILHRRYEIWQQWGLDDPRQHPDFAPTDLRGMNLNNLDFNNHNLSYTDLSGADLSGANLYWAELTDSNLTNANLSWANLAWCRLDGANLTRANLSGANLSFAHLDGVDLSRAILYETLFVDVDLSTAIGLETVEHHASSPISVETIYRSTGKIPEVFLRGAGVPEEFITYLPALLGKPIQFYSCFISHSSKDKPFARRLYDALQGQGIRCWLDEHQLLPGDDLYEQIDQGIRLWDKILLCCSQHSLTSWWVDDEVTRAFEKEQQLMRKRGKKVLALIPLNLDGYMFSDEWHSAKAAQIKSRLAADFTNWEHDNDKFVQQFERVVRALRLEDGGREPAPEPRL